MLYFQEVLDLLTIERFRIFGQHDPVKNIMIIDPNFRRLIFLINHNAIGHHNDKLSEISQIIQSIMNLFVVDRKFIHRDNCVVFIKYKIVDTLFWDNLAKLTYMVNHGCGPEKMRVEQQIVCYF